MNRNCSALVSGFVVKDNRGEELAPERKQQSWEIDEYRWVNAPESSNWVSNCCCCCCCCWEEKLEKSVEKNGFMGRLEDVHDVFIEFTERRMSNRPALKDDRLAYLVIFASSPKQLGVSSGSILEEYWYVFHLSTFSNRMIMRPSLSLSLAGSASYYDFDCLCILIARVRVLLSHLFENVKHTTHILSLSSK